VIRNPFAQTKLIGPEGAASSEHYRFLLDMARGVNGTQADVASTQADVAAIQTEQAARRIVAYGKQAASYTLASNTNWQQLFNWSTNGRVPVGVGHYRFECMYRMTGMSATSGNAGFRLSGTAVLAEIMRQNFGHDGANTAANATSGLLDVTNESDFDIVTANTSLVLSVMHRGTFRVATAGTIRPQVKLTTAAAAVVTTGSYFVLERLADDFTFGEWE
jgi:hypothetical protein